MSNVAWKSERLREIVDSGVVGWVWMNNVAHAQKYRAKVNIRERDDQGQVEIIDQESI